MRILFMTVGTGVGKDENRVKNLAHGLLSAIKEHNPNKVIFFGSDESKETVKELERMYYESEQKKLNYKFVTIKNVDNFYDCFSNIEEKIIENKDDEILIDYTSGTKTMTTSAAIAAMLYQKSLFITTGKRGENGVVIPGTEEIKKQNLFAAYDKYLMDKTKEAFNLYRYEDAKNHINKIVAHSDKEILKRVIEAYSLWDKFNHDEAWKILKDVKLDALNQNKQFLAMMDKKKKEGHLIEDFLIPDLLNNAFRRIKEGKYDDATARLYRAIEMIAQYRLKDRY
ncbi:MAG TPA: TIGR02710 family CRISPR-associated protein, partial [Candidatus Atribacteria bacterium]|nr:TIGR02710 family CRISPR-associated protein [Candidatus Atribacteria bacterium]